MWVSSREMGKEGRLLDALFRRDLYRIATIVETGVTQVLPSSDLVPQSSPPPSQTPRQAECNPRRLMENVRSVPYKGPDGTFDGLAEKGDCESKS